MIVRLGLVLLPLVERRTAHENDVFALRGLGAAAAKRLRKRMARRCFMSYEGSSIYARDGRARKVAHACPMRRVIRLCPSNFRRREAASVYAANRVTEAITTRSAPKVQTIAAPEGRSQ